MARKDSRDLFRRYLALKESFMLRDPAFQRAAADFETLVPTKEEYVTWPPEKQDDLNLASFRFAETWGCSTDDPWTVTKHPCRGGESVSNNALGVVLFGSFRARLLVLGLDVRLDLDTLLTEVAYWVLRRRRYQARDKEWLRDWVNSGRRFRYGKQGEDVLREAVEAWDRKRQGLTRRAIARELFGARNAEANLEKVKKRLRLAKRIIEKGQYRDILPLAAVGASRELIDEAMFRRRGASA